MLDSNNVDTFRESVCSKLPSVKPGLLKEGYGDDLPLVIFSEIHAITADKVTLNKTYYPVESLRGNPAKGSGVISYCYPYPVPMISDHNISGGFFGGSASDPYGRIYNASLVSEANGYSWIKAIAAITDPSAISKVLTRRYMTVSQGGKTNEVYCSVCKALGANINMVEEGVCEHRRGQMYEVAGEQVQCYWIMGPIYTKELSFVNSPSDTNASVLRPNISDGEARSLLAGTDGEYLIDMAQGKQVTSESCIHGFLGISKAIYESILEDAVELRDKYRKAGIDITSGFTTYGQNSQSIRALRESTRGL